MKRSERMRVIQYLIETHTFYSILCLNKEQRQDYYEAIFDTFGFKWWILCNNFNKLEKDVQKKILPVFNKILFGGRVK